MILCNCIITKHIRNRLMTIDWLPVKSSIMKYVWKLNEDIQNAICKHWGKRRMWCIEANKPVMILTYIIVYKNSFRSSWIFYIPRFFYSVVFYSMMCIIHHINVGPFFEHSEIWEHLSWFKINFFLCNLISFNNYFNPIFRFKV